MAIERQGESVHKLEFRGHPSYMVQQADEADCNDVLIASLYRYMWARQQIPKDGSLAQISEELGLQWETLLFPSSPSFDRQARLHMP